MANILSINVAPPLTRLNKAAGRRTLLEAPHPYPPTPHLPFRSTLHSLPLNKSEHKPAAYPRTERQGRKVAARTGSSTRARTLGQGCCYAPLLRSSGPNTTDFARTRVIELDNLHQAQTLHDPVRLDLHSCCANALTTKLRLWTNDSGES